MHNYYPLLLVGGIIGTISLLLLIAYGLVKDKKEAMGFERNMKDSEIMQRLVKYAAPYKKEFIFVGFLMLFSIAYSIISPLIVGQIEELVVGDFPLNTLFLYVAAYAAILLISMACSYFQAMILQKTGQKILSQIRLRRPSTHIEAAVPRPAEPDPRGQAGDESHQRPQLPSVT